MITFTRVLRWLRAWLLHKSGVEGWPREGPDGSLTVADALDAAWVATRAGQIVTPEDFWHNLLARYGLASNERPGETRARRHAGSDVYHPRMRRVGGKFVADAGVVSPEHMEHWIKTWEAHGFLVDNREG